MSLLVTTDEEMRRLYGELQSRNGELEKQNAELAARIAYYEEQIRLANHQRFARSSEQISAGQEAFVFNEAEIACDPAEPEPTAEEAAKPRAKRPKGHRSQQLALLEIREVEYPVDTPPVCSCCQNEMHFVKWDTTEKVDLIPPKALRILHKQPIFACRGCQNEGEPSPIKMMATMPAQAFPKSIASPSLVAYLISQKYVMGSPLYRQEQYIDGLGVMIRRQTMANWMLRAADLFTPLYNRMKQILVFGDIVHADETEVQVLREPGRAATTKSAMWLYRSGRYGPPIALFDYQTSRAGKHPKQFLAGFGGYDPQTQQIVRIKYLQVDGHDGYDCVPYCIIMDSRKVPDVVLVGCMAHARRKFVDALAVLDKKDQRKAVAECAVQYFKDLYEIEAELRAATPEERYTARQARSAPIVDAFKKWLDEQALAALPKTSFGQAISYCLNQWPKLIQFLQDGRLEIDNNRAERTIKPFVIGRKNWLFANTPRGAKASAILYSIVETAKENNLTPYEYLKYLLERLPNINTTDLTALDTLLPWSVAIPDALK